MIKMKYLKREIEDFDCLIAWGSINERGENIVDCPYCDDQHIHGRADGHRVAHCGSNSKYKNLSNNGYVVVNRDREDAWELR